MKHTDKILVTGASGFIGSHILRTLYQQGFTNLRASSYSRDLRNDFDGCETIELVKGDLRNEDFCNQVSKDVDVVFHCSANTTNALDTKENPLLHVTPNVQMNVNLMEQSWRNSVRKFIFISSNTVYPEMGDEYCSEEIDVPKTDLIPVYKAVGGMKRYGESLCDFFSNQIHNPMQCVVIRPGNAYGPNDKFDFEKCHVTPASVRKIADNMNPIPVWGDGSDIRDLLYVEDMAEGIVFVAEHVDTYDYYNVCYGKGHSVNEVLHMLKEIDGNNNPIEYGTNKAFMISKRLLSNEKVKELGWEPKYTLKEGLAKTLEWYRENRHLYDPNSKL
jgi:GDP-L-fucose synthase